MRLHNFLLELLKWQERKCRLDLGDKKWNTETLFGTYYPLNISPHNDEKNKIFYIRDEGVQLYFLEK